MNKQLRGDKAQSQDSQDYPDNSPQPKAKRESHKNSRNKQRKSNLKKILKEKLGIDDLREIKLKGTYGSQFEFNTVEGLQSSHVIKDEHYRQEIKNTDNNDDIKTKNKYNNTQFQELHLASNEAQLRQSLTLSYFQSINTLDSNSEKFAISDLTSLFKVQGLLGVGAFGVVLLVVNRLTCQQSALKIINKTRLSPEAIEILKNESSILQTLNHSNIVNFKQIFENHDYILIEMEYVEGGQLKKLFKKSPSLSEREVSMVIKNVLDGVNYIHERDYIHRDLKPENILLCNRRELDIKIVDFGLSAAHRVLNFDQIDDKIGTLIYMAPEQASYQSYAKRIDIWAVGIIMYQLMSSGKHPLYTKEDSYYQYQQKLRALKNGPILWEFPSNFSKLAQDFFKKLCSYPPTERYDAKSALKHPWITGQMDADIPLTQNEQLRKFDSEQEFRKIMRTVFFISQINRKGSQRELNGSRATSQFLEYKKLLFKTSSPQFSTGAESTSTGNTDRDVTSQNPSSSNICKEQEQINDPFKSLYQGSLRKRQSSSIKKKKEQAVKNNLNKNSNPNLPSHQLPSYKSPSPFKHCKTNVNSGVKKEYNQFITKELEQQSQIVRTPQVNKQSKLKTNQINDVTSSINNIYQRPQQKDVLNRSLMKRNTENFQGTNTPNEFTLQFPLNFSKNPQENQQYSNDSYMKLATQTQKIDLPMRKSRTKKLSSDKEILTFQGSRKGSIRVESCMKMGIQGNVSDYQDVSKGAIQKQVNLRDLSSQMYSKVQNHLKQITGPKAIFTCGQKPNETSQLSSNTNSNYQIPSSSFVSPVLVSKQREDYVINQLKNVDSKRKLQKMQELFKKFPQQDPYQYLQGTLNVQGFSQKYGKSPLILNSKGAHLK